MGCQGFVTLVTMKQGPRNDGTYITGNDVIYSDAYVTPSHAVSGALNELGFDCIICIIPFEKYFVFTVNKNDKSPTNE